MIATYISSCWPWPRTHKVHLNASILGVTKRFLQSYRSCHQGEEQIDRFDQQPEYIHLRIRKLCSFFNGKVETNGSSNSHCSCIDETDHLTDFFKHALNVYSFCILRMNCNTILPFQDEQMLPIIALRRMHASAPVAAPIRRRINSNPFDWNKTQSTPCVRCKPVNLGSAMIGTLCFFASEISRSAP